MPPWWIPGGALFASDSIDSMSEEIELNAGDAEIVTPDTFSFFEMMDAVSYPTDEVTVFLDEAAAHSAQKIVREFNEMEDPTEKELKDFKDRIAKLRQRIEDSKVTFYLKGVPDEIVTGAKDMVDERFMDKRKQIRAADGSLRKYLPEEHALAYARLLNATVTSMHIEKAVYHKNGAEFPNPEPDFIAAFYDKAPTAAQQLLSEAVSGLRVQSVEYEQSFDEGFFPKS